MKWATLSDLFTADELNEAIKLNIAKEICEKVVKPKMDHINKVTGQENDPMYIAYALENAIYMGSITKVIEEQS